MDSIQTPSRNQSLVPTLEGMKEKALAIKNSVNEPHGIESATSKAKLLYQEGITLLKSQVKGKPLFFDIVSPVVVILNQIDLEMVQHDTFFLQTLSKTYSLFIELTSIQCRDQQNMPIFGETVDAINRISDRMICAFSNRNINIFFEYSCAREAAKGLHRVGGFYGKFADDIVTHAEQVSPFGVMKTGASFISEKPSGWYQEVCDLRYEAARITSEKKFNAFILPFAKKFQQNGGKYTICLAKVLMDLIERGDTLKIKDLALREIQTLLQLKEQEPLLERFLSAVRGKKSDSQTVVETAKKADRYWATRTLIGECVFRLDNTNIYIHPIVNALLTVTKEPNQVSLEIESLLKKVETKHQEFTEQIQAYVELFTPIRGSDIGTMSKETEDEYNQLLARRGEVEKEIQNITLIKSALEQIQNEEIKKYSKLLEQS